jgi:hypothetical protein
MSAIDQAEQGGKISADDAKALRLSALKKSVGDDPSKDAETSSAQKKLDVINNAQKSNAIRPSVAENLNEGVLRDLIPGNNSKTSADTMTDVVKKIDPNDIEKLSLSQDGAFEVIKAGYGPVSTRRTAPAQKTGLSGLGTDQGTPTPTAQKLLEGTKSVLDTLGDAIAKWKDSPDPSLTNALVETLAEATTEAAEEIIDEIPMLHAMKLATKYALVFADGIGEGIEQASRELGPMYTRATEYSYTGNGLSDDDLAAIQFARRWMANDLRRLNGILMQGVSAVVRKAAGEFADWLSTEATKKLFSMTTSLATHLLNKTPLQGVALGIVNATAKDIPESRREAYGLALSASFGMFVRQLDNPDLRKKLKPLVDARGAKEFDKAVIKGLASCLVEGTLGDPKAKDGSSFLANLREESRQWTLQRLNQLIAALPASITVVSTPGGPTSGDEIRIPAALLREVLLSEAPAAQDAFDRSFAVSIAIEPVKKAAEANLLILARARQPQVVKLARSGGDAEVQRAAYNAYWEEVTKICANVTKQYIAAGGDPDVESWDALRVETFDFEDPENWRQRFYSLIGRNGGGRGAFSSSTIIWRTRAGATDPGGGGMQFA